MQWAGKELASCNLGDTRLDLRLMKIVDTLSEHAAESLPCAFKSLSDAKRAYSFWNNDRVEAESILEGHRARTVARALEEAVVLVIQDTTAADLTSHAATKGLGYLHSRSTRGFLAHSCLAVTEQGMPLGLVNEKFWTRPVTQLGKRYFRKRKKTAEKESQRWLDGLAAIQEALHQHPHVVVMGDQEADIYDLFAAPRNKNTDLLVRVCRQNRRIDHPLKYLKKALASTPVAGEVTISVPRKRGQKARNAKLSVRFATFAICRPSGRSHGKPIPLNFILVEEINPPPNQKPIRWLLATTMPVTNLEEALRCVQMYTRRWTVERYHFTLKSGFKIEAQQLEDVESIQRFLATIAIVAWRVMWITYQARENPDAPCTVILNDDERDVLFKWAHRKNKKPSPRSTPTVQEAVKLIAQLGGHMGRRSDGPPGVKVIWRGLSYLTGLTDGYNLARHPPDSNEDCG